MITRERYELLCSEELRRAVDASIGRDPLDIALDKRLAHAAEVATQVKYLQRARRKLPSWYGARCILPSLAFEQSSSEACASRKRLSGGSVLDLTCGLGVDAAMLAGRFDSVTTVERDAVLADVARENFRRLGLKNIEVVCASAEEFVAACGRRFDWCYADPDRRGSHGEKLVRAEDCSPDIVGLMPRLRELADGVCVKLSPLFDVDEAFRLFGECGVEVVSSGDECKEVLVYIDGRPSSVTAVSVEGGSFSAERGDTVAPAPPAEFRREAYRWLVQPDVALQKSRLAQRALAGIADIWSDNGYGFAVGRPDAPMCRLYEIDAIERFDPKRLRREMKGCRAEILKRDFPMSVQRITAATGIREGGMARLAFGSAAGEFWVIRLK